MWLNTNLFIDRFIRVNRKKKEKIKGISVREPDVTELSENNPKQDAYFAPTQKVSINQRFKQWYEEKHNKNNRKTTWKASGNFQKILVILLVSIFAYSSKLIIEYYYPKNDNLVSKNASMSPINVAETVQTTPNIEMVTIGNFAIGKYDITQAQWVAIMGSNPSAHKGCDNCPVENVSWNDVYEFIQKLNNITGKNYRLPTDAEWDFAAKGGRKTHNYKYAGSNDIKTVAWYNGNSSNTTHPVGQKQPNELGIYDLSGNVLQWCSDSYDSSQQYRVIRGGGWYGDPAFGDIAYRSYYTPGNRLRYIGFRIASTTKPLNETPSGTQ